MRQHGFSVDGGFADYMKTPEPVERPTRLAASGLVVVRGTVCTQPEKREKATISARYRAAVGDDRIMGLDWMHGVFGHGRGDGNGPLAP